MGAAHHGAGLAQFCELSLCKVPLTNASRTRPGLAVFASIRLLMHCKHGMINTHSTAS